MNVGSAEIEGAVLRAAAQCLGVLPEHIDPQASLARYGMDSLKASELTAALSQIAGREVAEEMMLDYPSVAELARLLAAGSGPGVARCLALSARLSADRVLPDDVQPLGVPAARDGALLITGATGFLGAHLLAELLRRTRSEIVCLVRADGESTGRERLQASLRRFAVAVDAHHPRIRIAAGDVTQRELGLPQAAYRELCRCVRSVYHSAAEVDWDKPYEALAPANVGGTLQLLRFASRHVRKAFHFVSSIAACYSTTGPSEVSEAHAPVDIGGMHVGYALSKWVAEALVRSAAQRGLTARIYRPGLIAGHSDTGVGNNDDLLALLFKGCIALGEAPELAWQIDACPVDFVAAAIASLSATPAGDLAVAHLTNPRPRAWLEAVLWLNLYGYAVRPVAFDRWIKRVRRECADPRHPLHRLRGFLLRRIEAEGGLHLPELFEVSRLPKVRSEWTEAQLALAGVRCSPLGAPLLERWFSAYRTSGFLAPPRAPGRVRGNPRADITPVLERALQAHFADPALRIHAARGFDVGGDNSILGELASWRSPSAVPLSGHALEIASRNAAPRHLRVVVKPKFADETVLAVATKVATLCGDRVGAAFAAHARRTALLGSAEREIAFYQQREARLRACAPTAYGVLHMNNQCALLLEHVADGALIDGADLPARWTRTQIEAALAGIAEVHALWLGEERPSRHLAWLGPVLDADGVAAAAELWLTLSEHARPWLAQWAGEQAADTHAMLARASAERAHVLARLPRGLIHHDFNPRNIVLRRAPSLRLCAFDWELATFGVPQRDLAEFLCFVLPVDVSAQTLAHFVEFHRRALERSLHAAVDRADWLLGLRLALADFAVDRLAMYLLAHRFRPQRFLLRVVRVWHRLYSLAATCEPESSIPHAR